MIKKRKIVYVVLFLVFALISVSVHMGKSEVKLVANELKENPRLNDFLEKIGALDSESSLKQFFGAGESVSMLTVAERMQYFTSPRVQSRFNALEEVDASILKAQVRDYIDLYFLSEGLNATLRRTLNLEGMPLEQHAEMIETILLLGQVEDKQIADSVAMLIGNERNFTKGKEVLIGLGYGTAEGSRSEAIINQSGEK